MYAILALSLLAAPEPSAQERNPAVRLLVRPAQDDTAGATEATMDIREVLRKPRSPPVLTYTVDEDEAELVLFITRRRMGSSAPGVGAPCIVRGVLVDRRDGGSQPVGGSGSGWREATLKLLDAVRAYAEGQQHAFLRRRSDWPNVRFEFEPLTRELQRELGAKDGKVLITVVQAVGAAATAGLHAGDAIDAADGKELKHAADLARAIYTAQPGSSLKLDVLQQGTRRTATLVVP